MAAKHLRDHAEDCCPFLGMLPSDPEFVEYCEKVESVSGAEWGGQLEIRALCESLGRKIMIYAADGPVVAMGEDTVKNTALQPLRLAYHRHYYALGEHYNSVVPIIESCSCGLDT